MEPSTLHIQLGDNRITGSASLQQRLAGQVDLNLPRLGQLWPELRGQTERATGPVAGTPKAPQGSLTLQGTQLAFADNRLQSLHLDATLDSAQRAEIDPQGQRHPGRRNRPGHADRQRPGRYQEPEAEPRLCKGRS